MPISCFDNTPYSEKFKKYSESMPELTAAIRVLNEEYNNVNKDLNKVKESLDLPMGEFTEIEAPVEEIPVEENEVTQPTLFADSNDSLFNDLDNLVNNNPSYSSRMLNIRRGLSQKVEAANSAIFERTKNYSADLLKEIKKEDLPTTQNKLERLEEAFDVVVVEDTTMEAKGAILASNHPLSVMYGRPVIKINPNTLTNDTVIHEFGHLYIALLGGMQDSLVQDAVEILRDSELWGIVKDNYPELSGDNLAEEVLATALGIEGNRIYQNDVEKRTIWQQIKDKLLSILSNIFGGAPTNAIEQLASEIIGQSPVRTSTQKFNSIIDQRSKMILEEVTQDSITKHFENLNNRFQLDEQTHTYKDTTENKDYKNTVSTFAKNIAYGRRSTRKGDWDIEFLEEDKLTKENWRAIISKPVIPKALDDAMQAFFQNELDTANPSLVAPEDAYWHNFYVTQTEENEIFQDLLENSIESNVDAINDAAFDIQARLDVPRLAGDMVHNALEDLIANGTDLPSNLIDEKNILTTLINQIMERGKKEGSVFFTEQTLFSEAAEKPGSADLIEITKDGKFRIYDYKTMATFMYKGKPKNDYMMYVINGYVNQVLVYGTILEEYGIEPADDALNILAMEVENSDYPNSVTIKDAKLKNISSTDPALFSHIQKARNIITAAFRNADKLKEYDIKTQEETVQELVEKITRGIDDYKRLTDSRRGKFKEGLLNEKSIKNLEADIAENIKKATEESNKHVILSYIDNIRNAMTEVYGQSAGLGDALTSSYVANVDFLLQTTSFIPAVKDFLRNAGPDYQIQEKDAEELLELVEETEEAVRKLKNFADIKTKELAVLNLSMYSNFMEGVFSEKYELEAKQRGLNKDEYIMKKIRENKALIEAREFEYWNGLLNNGYMDIRYMEYLLADPGMNKSQFVQVVKNIIDKVDQDVRTDLDNSIADLVNWHKNLGFKTTGDPKKIWSKFMEQGEYTDLDGNKVKFTRPALMSEKTSDYREIVQRYTDQLNYIDGLISRESDPDQLEALKADKQRFIDQLKEKRRLADRTLRNNPAYDKLSKEEKDALKFMQDKLRVADERLFAAAPHQKLTKNLGDGTVIYNIPRKRKSYLEAAYEGDKAINRFRSGLLEFFSPRADEDDLNITEDEFRAGNTDILGDPLYEVPVFYRNQLEDPDLQSFDLPSLLAFNEETTIMFEKHKMIEADLYMITNSLNPKKGGVQSLKTDNMISRKVTDKINNRLPKDLKSDNNLVFKAVQASINNRFYKRSYTGVYSKTNYRAIKAGEALGRYTSAVLLAGNFGSASMTGIQGTIYRFIEGAAGEDFSLSDVKVGSQKTTADLTEMIVDSQRQFPRSKTALLIRRFGLETQYKALVNKFVQDNFITKNLDQGSIFAITSIAETMVTGNLMYTLLNNIKVMNSKGEYITKDGKVTKSRDKAMSLDEAYTVEEGKLVLDKNVVYTEKNLNSKFKDTQVGEKTIAATEISRFIRSKYADLYGQYNQDMKSVAEMNVLGKLAFSMRKWIPRGYHRRFRGLSTVASYDFYQLRTEEARKERFYSQDQQKFQEGFYTTGLRYMLQLRREMRRKGIGFAAANTAVKTQMTEHEVANLKRTAYEFAIMASSFAAALLLSAIAKHMDDDDEGQDAVYFAAYLTERIKIESATFLNPFELIDNLKNPAAAVNTLNRIGKLLDNLFSVTYDEDIEAFDFSINNEYERGEREGELKLWRNITGLLPFYRKFSQAKGILGLDSKETIKDSYEYMIR